MFTFKGFYTEKAFLSLQVQVWLDEMGLRHLKYLICDENKIDGKALLMLQVRHTKHAQFKSPVFLTLFGGRFHDKVQLQFSLITLFFLCTGI